MSLQITVASPCAGTQTVNTVATDIWAGASGSFSYAILSLDPTATFFQFTVYTNDTGSPCYPFAAFGQVTPDTSDPAGQYGLMVGGSPDTGAGSGSVI